MGSAAETVIVTVVVTVVLFWALVAALTVIVVRRARRHVRAIRARRHQGVDPAGARGLDIGAVAAVAASTLGSPGWWLVQRDRHRMWRAVSSAEHAIGVARKAGAPVGDLPTLARQLATAARAVDAVVGASARRPSSRSEARAEMARIEVAAADLHLAALESLTLVSRAETDDVVSSTRIELDALAAGLAAVRATSAARSSQPTR